MGIPALAAFNTISPESLPLEARMHLLKSVSALRAEPITLSRALCLPTSSEKATSPFSVLYSRAEWVPPVSLKVRLFSLRLFMSPDTRSGSTFSALETRSFTSSASGTWSSPQAVVINRDFPKSISSMLILVSQGDIDSQGLQLKRLDVVYAGDDAFCEQVS